MEQLKFGILREHMLLEAEYINNQALVKAITFSNNNADLQNCVKQAHGVGTEKFRAKFANIL